MNNTIVNLSIDVYNKTSLEILKAHGVCGNNLKCAYERICGGLDSDYIHKGAWLVGFVCLANWFLWWFVQNKSKYFKGKLLEYDFSNKFDRVVFAYNVQSYIVICLVVYVVVWVFLEW